MSGIAGIIHFDRMPVQAGDIERMTGAMSHRARDGVAHWVNGHAALGHCLLRTTVEAADDRQPLVDAESGRVLVFDGRLDNFRELAADLRGAGTAPRNLSDSELVLRAYERWGPGSLERLDGDFAFALWDARQETLFCARDRVGSRPFHHHRDGTTFAFASDACALLALPWVAKQLNLDFIAEMLAADWTSLENTYWSGVQRLPPAHRLIVTRNGCQPSKYWQPRLDVSLPCRSPQEYADYYRALLFDVVQRMGRSSGPVACEVSGGLDSSALFAVAADLQRRGEWPAPDLQGYTLDFRGQGDADEMDYALAVAQHVGKPVSMVPPTRKSLDWCLEWMAQEAYPASYPNGVMGLGIREEARRQGCSSLLVGVGGDEWLDGYPAYYAEAIAARHWRELWRILAEDSRDVGPWQASAWLARYGLAPLLPAGVRRRIHAFLRRRSGGEDWLAEPMRARLRQRRARQPRERPVPMRVGQRSHLLQLEGAFSLLARESEEMHCAHTGLEIRRPFWHPRLIEFALATPERVRCQGSTSKAIHRRAMAGLLPETVRQRSTKADFMIAFHWSTVEMREELARALPLVSDWVRPDRVRRVLRDYGKPGALTGAEWRAWYLFDCYTVLLKSLGLEGRTCLRGITEPN